MIPWPVLSVKKTVHAKNPKQCCLTALLTEPTVINPKTAVTVNGFAFAVRSKTVNKKKNAFVSAVNRNSGNWYVQVSFVCSSLLHCCCLRVCKHVLIILLLKKKEKSSKYFRLPNMYKVRIQLGRKKIL